MHMIFAHVRNGQSDFAAYFMTEKITLLSIAEGKQMFH